MGECRIWIEQRDNPHLSEQEITERNRRYDRLLNDVAYHRVIDEQFNREQGPPWPEKIL